MHDRHATVAPELRGYRAEELIGRGGTGEVYRALDVRLERQVALKVLAAGVAEDERFRERFLSESRLAASLDHPNVIPIYEAGEQDERLFIAMRYVRGRDLKTLLRRKGALEPARTVAIARQLAEALDAAHRTGLVHRDVKPSNVLLDSEEVREHCYLADFGLTQSATERGPTDGQFMGTVAYVSPEQIRGEQVDGRADQYGLACLIFECLTGSVPYGGRSDVATIFAHLQEPVPKPSERADLPLAIDDVIARGMAKAPDERYESCTALVAAAADALELRPAERSSRPRLVAGLAAAVLALAAVLGVSLLAGSDAPKAEPSGGLVRIDPQTNRVTREVGVRGHPGEIVEHSRGPLDGRFSRRRPVALRARLGNARACHLERASRETWLRSATRSTSERMGASCQESCRATTLVAASERRGSTCWPARWPPARACSGRRAARSCSA